MLIELVVFIGYLLLIAYYRYVSISIIDVETAKGANDQQTVKNVFLVFTSVMFCLFWGYTLFKNIADPATNPLLGKGHLYFILAMSIYLSLSLGIMTNMGFKWFIVAILGVIGLIVLPFLFKGVFDNGINRLFPGGTEISTSTAESGNAFANVIYPFYASYGFLFGAIIIALLVMLSYLPKFNIPNLGTWQQWATIATVVFGLKHFLFYRFSSSNMYLILGLLAVITALTFFMIQPTPTTQTTLTVLFSISCILLAVLLPNDIPYLTLGFFAVSLVASIAFGLFAQRLNFSTVQVLFGIFAVYLVIHFANSIQTAKGKQIGDMFSKISNFGTAVGLYLIVWVMITTLYSTNLGKSNDPLNIATIVLSTAMMVLSMMVFGGMAYISTSGKTGDGMWIGALTTLIGILLIMYYLVSNAYGAHLNYAIVAFMLMFTVGTLGFMAYNLKNIVNLLLFFLVFILPIIFIYLLKKSTSGMSSAGSGSSGSGNGFLVNVKNPGMLIGGIFLLLIWVAISILFWSSSNLTFETLLNSDVLNISLAGLLLYLTGYYVYETVTSKASISQRFSQIALIVMCFYLFLQIFKKSKMAKNPFVSFLVQVVEYIPCLYDNIVTRVLNAKPDETMKEDFTYNSTGAMIIGAVAVMVLGYYLYPHLRKWTATATHTSGTTLVGDAPLAVNETHFIKTYEELTGTTEKPLYNYGVSFSIMINPTSGNDTFYKVVNFCGNLVVAYNTAKNQLLIYTLQEGKGEEPPQVVLYRYNQFPLQKWVKIDVNYVGGIFDVFVDNQLKTSHKVVAYNSHENVIVGESGSLVLGKVKDFMYFEKPLSMTHVDKPSSPE
jgi:hypothetical protein